MDGKQLQFKPLYEVPFGAELKASIITSAPVSIENNIQAAIENYRDKLTSGAFSTGSQALSDLFNGGNLEGAIGAIGGMLQGVDVMTADAYLLRGYSTMNMGSSCHMIYFLDLYETQERREKVQERLNQIFG